MHLVDSTKVQLRRSATLFCCGVFEVIRRLRIPFFSEDGVHGEVAKFCSVIRLEVLYFAAGVSFGYL